MQTKALLLASGILDCSQIMMQRPAALQEATVMSKTASIGFGPSATLFGRLMASIDRLLMTSARIAVRNGGLPYFGL